MRSITQRIAGRGVFQPRQCDNIAGISFFNIITLVGMHQQHTPDSFFLVFNRVIDVRTGLQRTRINTGKRQGTDKRVVHNLERQRRQRFFVIGLAGNDFVRTRLGTFYVRQIKRRRQIIDNRVQQWLNAFVFESCSAQYRNKRHGQRPFTNALFERFGRNFLALKIVFHGLIIHFNRHFDQFGMIFFCLVFQLSRNILNFNRRIRRIAGINNRFHIKQINNAFEFGFGANRQLQSQRLCPQTIDNHIQAAIEVRSDSVHLIAETDSRNIVLVCLAPYGLGLRLNAGNGIEYRDCAVQNAQRTLDFNRKVNVSRRIDDVDSVAFPVTGCRSRGNGNTAFLLLFHPVHRCSTVVRLADFMIYACIIQDTFCCSGFTGINMSHDADISVHL